jgi:hypothetical protein
MRAPEFLSVIIGGVTLTAVRFDANAALIAEDLKKPASFPHRIWAACDFEGRTHADYGWFGKAQSNSVPHYPGNRTALRADRGPYGKHAAIMAGINPVPGPRMGKENWLYLRYFLHGGSTGTFQHFSLTSEDNWHVNVSGLRTNTWAELAVNFTTHARRNDGSAPGFGEGERMDDFKLFAGHPGEAAGYELSIDDVIFFANDPNLPPEPEPFPNRVIFLAAFDTGERKKYWPGDLTLVDNPPAGAYWKAARSVAKPGVGQMISLRIDPPRPVGSHTKLRFRYYLSGATQMTVQIFDATVQDNRHLVLRDLPQNQWRTMYVDLFRNARRNDGTVNSEFSSGNLVDDIFFFVNSSEAGSVPALFVDEVVLFDAGK